ncbi:galanin receptor 2a-like [Rhopilema esculentum]|uniref:galanin receptor 2a-like n=1 Tax=Rhopilema esculentum TaxID=499914 RepID=UPI0031E35932|eukprot:gene668-10374_t
MENTTLSPTSQANNVSNSSHNFAVEGKSKNLIIAEITVYCIVFFLSSIGNIVVILVVSRKRRMQTVTNWLIVNLAIADLAVTLICIPVEIPLILKGVWLYGRVFCHMLYPLQTMTIYASVYTLVAMSLTRYWAIRHPFRRQMSTKQAKILICFLWLISFSFVVPYIIRLNYDPSQQACIEVSTPQGKRNYTIAIFVSQYIFPLMLILFAYILIAVELSGNPKGDATLTQKQKQKENTKVLTMVVVVTVTFACCVLPYHVVGLYLEFSKSKAFPHQAEVSTLSYLLLFANSCMNPIIYNAFNSKFRESFKDLWNELLNCGKTRDYMQRRRYATMYQREKSVQNGRDSNANHGGQDVELCTLVT